MKKNDGLNDNDVINNDEIKSIFLSGLILTLMGIPLTLFLFKFGEPLLNFLVSSDSDQNVVKGAISYLNIRSISLVCTLLNDVVFGFSLGLQNITAPMYSIIIAFIANVIGDIVLIKYLGLGLKGAAYATTFSTVLGSSVGLYVLLKRYQLLNNPKKLLKQLDISKMKDFFRTSTTLFVGTMLNTLTYSSGASISSFAKNKVSNTIDIAAFQILMQQWWLLSYFSSPVGLIGQALLPKEIKAGDFKKSKFIVTILMKLAVVVAFFTTSVVTLVPSLFPSFFTRDLLVQQAFQKEIFAVALSLFIICITTVQDGIYIGSGRIYDYVMAGGFSTSFAWIYFIYSIYARLGVHGAWNGLLIFSIVRFIWYAFRWPKLWRGFKE